MSDTIKNDITFQELEEVVRDELRKQPSMIKDLVDSWNVYGQPPLTPKEYLMEIVGFDPNEADELVARM